MKKLKLGKPNPFDILNEGKRLAAKEYPDHKMYSNSDKETMITFQNIYLKGYKAAQSKQFSLEDVQEIVEDYFKVKPHNIKPYAKDLAVHLLASLNLLSTQQLPKEFIPEYEVYHKCDKCDSLYGTNDGYCDVCRKSSKAIVHKSLKTITNSEGKQEIVGTYKY